MQRASNKAYVSNRKLQKYQEEKMKQQEKMEVIQEDAVEESLADIDMKMPLAGGEEVKQSDRKRAAFISEVAEDDESDNSAEGVDSDDLEDEIMDPALMYKP
jgi:hypothetical protein